MLAPTSLLPAVLLALGASALPAFPAEQLTLGQLSNSRFPPPKTDEPDLFPGHDLHKLNDGRWLPSPAFGVGSVWHDDEHRQLVTDAVLSALTVGYRHIGKRQVHVRVAFQEGSSCCVEADCGAGLGWADNSAIYGTEQFVGEALAQAGIAREELFITTKFDNIFNNETSVERTFQLSLDKLGLDYVDLYLIHFPQFARPAAPVWREFEALVERGLVRSIGLSNYNQTDLQEILDLPGLKVKPAVNQIRYHPYSTPRPLSPLAPPPR